PLSTWMSKPRDPVTGANANASPPMNPPIHEPVSSRTRAKVARPFSGSVNNCSALYASTAFPVTHMIGEVSGYAPSRCSVNAVTPDSGANAGKFHQPVESGRCFAFHATVDVFS